MKTLTRWNQERRLWWHNLPHQSKVTWCIYMVLAGVLGPIVLSKLGITHVPMRILMVVIYMLALMAGVTWLAVGFRKVTRRK